MKISNTPSYGERAAICARLAEQAVSDEAKAKLVYLGELWLVAAKVADLGEANKSHYPLGDDPRHLLPE
jgi:hypothetical protein